MNATVFIAASLDGFIARENGDIDWLTSIDGGEAGEDYGFKDFMDSLDAIVMGRNTFELVSTFTEWPYGSTPLFVLTSRELEIPDALKATVERMSGTPSQVAAALDSRGMENVYVDGGKTIQGFIADGLIRRIIITHIPVLLGRGIPLFGEVPGDVRLDHLRTQSYSNGLVQSEYAIGSAADDTGSDVSASEG